MTAEGDGVGVQTRTLALAWPLSQLFFFKSPLPERLSSELLRQSWKSSGSQDKFFLVAQHTRTGFKPTILRYAGKTGARVPIHGGQEETQRYEPVMTSAKMTWTDNMLWTTAGQDPNRTDTEIQQSGPNHLHWRHRLIYYKDAVTPWP